MEGSIQCRSSMTKSTGCWDAMRKNIIRKVQGLLLLLFGRYHEGIVGRQWEGEGEARIGTASAGCRPYCTTNPSSLCSFC